MREWLLLSSLVFCLVAGPVSARDVVEPNAAQRQILRAVKIPPATERLVYGPELTAFGDLRLPKGKGPFPVAVVIHGGAWRSYVTLDYIAPVADALTCAGIATWNIEYRRVGGGGEWPNMYSDVAKATDYLRVLQKNYPLDLSRVITIGHSAGGHLALWAAGRHNLPKSSALYSATPLPLRGVIALAGPGDIGALIEPQNSPYRATLLESMGGDINRLAEISPAALLPFDIPQVHIVGNQDAAIPPATVNDFITQVKAKGDDAEMLTLMGDHFISADAWDPVAGPVILMNSLKLVGKTIEAEQIGSCTTPR